MRVNCSICNFPIVSLLLPRERGLKDITNTLLNHAMEAHKEEWRGIITKVLQLQLLVSWLYGFRELAKVEGSEDWLLTELTKVLGQIMRLLGFEMTTMGQPGIPVETPPGEPS